jgi:hypothetical protein
MQNGGLPSHYAGRLDGSQGTLKAKMIIFFSAQRLVLDYPILHTTIDSKYYAVFVIICNMACIRNAGTWHYVPPRQYSIMTYKACYKPESMYKN